MHACIVSLLSLHELAGLERLCAKHDIGIAALPHYYGAGGLLNVFGLVRAKAAETTFDSHFRIFPVVFAEPPINYRLGRIFFNRETVWMQGRRQGLSHTGNDHTGGDPGL